jgi:hypothetical protein
MKGREICSSKLYKYNNLVLLGDIIYSVHQDHVMNQVTKHRFYLLTPEQKAEGYSISNFILKGDNFYWLMLNKEGYRVSVGTAKNYSQTSIEHIPIDHENIT